VAGASRTSFNGKEQIGYITSVILKVILLKKCYEKEKVLPLLLSSRENGYLVNYMYCSKYTRAFLPSLSLPKRTSHLGETEQITQFS
jgi:hypothetical protein